MWLQKANESTSLGFFSAKAGKKNPSCPYFGESVRGKMFSTPWKELVYRTREQKWRQNFRGGIWLFLLLLFPEAPHYACLSWVGWAFRYISFVPKLTSVGLSVTCKQPESLDWSAIHILTVKKHDVIDKHTNSVKPVGLNPWSTVRSKQCPLESHVISQCLSFLLNKIEGTNGKSLWLPLNVVLNVQLCFKK